MTTVTLILSRNSCFDLHRYKKPEIEVCDKLDCFVESETTTSPQEDLQNLTDRQRAVVKVTPLTG